MEPRIENRSAKRTGVSWSSVFAGTFVFLAIEATFEMLARAIFTPANAGPGLNPGAGIWMVILSIIALYFGAKTAVHFSGEARRLDGMYYGLITFGLSIFTAILITAGIVGSTPNALHAIMDGVAANAVWLFVTLILGGIAAAIGGAFSTSRMPTLSAVGERATLHPAA